MAVNREKILSKWNKFGEKRPERNEIPVVFLDAISILSNEKILERRRKL